MGIQFKNFPICILCARIFFHLLWPSPTGEGGSPVMFEDQDKETNSSSAWSAAIHNYSCHN